MGIISAGAAAAAKELRVSHGGNSFLGQHYFETKSMKKDTEQGAAEAEALFGEAARAEEQEMFVDATQFLLEAAKLGHTGAQINVGNNFSLGVGVPRSDERAAYWYKLACKNGSDAGALNLAIDRLRQGRTRSAVFWLKRAVGMGSGEAALELARVYLTRLNDKAEAILLETIQSMKRSEISEQAQEDAARLLLTVRKDFR